MFATPGHKLCAGRRQLWRGLANHQLFWKYKLQVVDNSLRCESRHFKTSLSLRALAQSFCTSGPHDARRALPIVAGELPTVTGAAVCVAELCALGSEAPVPAIIFPHDADNSLEWDHRHRTSPPPGCTPTQNRFASSPQVAARIRSCPRNRVCC